METKIFVFNFLSIPLSPGHSSPHSSPGLSRPLTDPRAFRLCGGKSSNYLWLRCCVSYSLELLRVFWLLLKTKVLNAGVVLPIDE